MPKEFLTQISLPVPASAPEHAARQGEVDAALSGKADVTALDDKADTTYVDGQLATKADLNHAGQHATAGNDPLTPGAIGAIGVAPVNGDKTYLAQGSAWVEYVPPDEGTIDHSQLENLDLPDQHPIAAVINLQAELDAKADLVNGKVPLAQMPLDTIKQHWFSDTVSNLVTLIDAKPGDTATITSGLMQGQVYVLIDSPPTDSGNWLNVTMAGGVISVNGQDGVVNLDLEDFPGVISALDAKAPLNAPAFTGNATAPTVATTVKNTRIATTKYVWDAMETKFVASTTDIGVGAALATGTFYFVYE